MKFSKSLEWKMPLAPSGENNHRVHKGGILNLKSPLAVMTATVSLAQTSPVLAETTTENSYKKYQPTLMNQVTVTATRSETQLKDVAGDVTVIGSE